METMLIRYKEALLRGMSEVLEDEKYNKFRLFLDSLDESGFLHLIHEIIPNSAAPATLKDYVCLREKILESFKTDITKTHYYSQQAKFLNEESKSEIVQQIRKSHPSDYIKLTRQEDLFLMDLWEPVDKKNLGIPSDIFFAQTVPLLDCKISVDETAEQNGRICKYRVVIFDNYKEIVEQALKDKFSDNKIHYVGALIPEPECFFIAIGISRGVNYLVSSIGFFDDNTQQKFGNQTNGFFAQYAVAMMETWYGIQIAMLHPTVRDIFRVPKTEVLHDINERKANQKRKRKVKYIRTHVLEIDNIEKLTGCKEERKYNRKCLAWYVIGHWRTYTNGKKVFVSPYWKGTLRNLKKNSEGDDRERKINIEWEVH